jgi:ribosomal protein S18 acetylase RimI-like enzyme
MGWPYRLEDWAFAQQLGEGLALERAGRLVGTAMRWHYGDDFATVGMIIVAKAFQGRGYGSRLIDALLDGAETRTVLLNATREGLELYGRRGFTRSGEVNQHQGVAVLYEPLSQSGRIRAADFSDLPTIVQLDNDAIGIPRGTLLQQLMQAGRLTVIAGSGAVSGYAACRPFGRGHVIGPVIAATVADARLLIEDSLSRLPAAFVRVDTPARSGLATWLEASGLKRVDTVAAMLRGAPPLPSGQAQVFALCSQSLG